MDNIWLLYSVDVILVSLFAYACCRYNKKSHRYIEMPDDYEHDPEVVYAQQQLGVLKDHAPLLTALDIGVMRLKTAGEWISFVLMEGFAEVENNIITAALNKKNLFVNIL